MGMEEDLTQGGEHRIQYTNDISQDCTLESYLYDSINQYNPNEFNEEFFLNDGK